MAKSSLNLVREGLQAYADRGVFRGFSEIKPGHFQFNWIFQRPIELIANSEKQELRFRQLLPGVPADSKLYGELKDFFKERHLRELPEHRRVDRSRAEVSCQSRRGFVTVSLKVKQNQYAYGVNRIINVVHELFLFLRNSHPDYLVENFDAPQE